jgi:hypothetical protein
VVVRQQATPIGGSSSRAGARTQTPSRLFGTLLGLAAGAFAAVALNAQSLTYTRGQSVAPAY